MKVNLSEASLALLASVSYTSHYVRATNILYTATPTNLSSAAVQQFKDCIDKTGVELVFAVDGNQLIVMPPLSNMTLSEADDAAVQDCIASVSSSINIAYEDGHSLLDEYIGPYTSDDLDLATLSGAGVSGLELIPKNGNVECQYNRA